MRRSGIPRQAKFFCEHCGSEVPREAKICRVCGRFFASVRCPKCGASGTPSDFRNGCQECGYAINGQGHSGRKPAHLKKDRGGKRISAGTEQSLPVWVYAVSLSALAVLAAITYGCLQ